MTKIEHVGPAALSPLATEYMVRMRDGVRLASDLYLPEGKTGTSNDVDTILIRLPYDKAAQPCYIPLIAEYFNKFGYAVVAQDVRGKFRSEGEALIFVNEAEDGYDTIEWIINQPWSNGRVAMWGDSYYGYTQLAAASTEHPALKAISPRVTGSDLGEPVRHIPGAHERRVEWAITYLYLLTYFHSNDNYFWEFDRNSGSFAQQCERIMQSIGSRSISYDQWFPSPVHLSRFPNGSPFASRPVPTLQTIGWWDNCAFLSWNDFYEVQQNPAWDMNYFLRIESMDHESYYIDDPEDFRVLERSESQLRESLPRMLDPTIEFFEIFVRQRGSWRDMPKVSWNLAGTKGMRTSEVWPPHGTIARHLFAHSDGTLLASAPHVESSITWVHDPQNLVPSSVENAFAFLLASPDESQISAREDVITFISEPVDSHLDLVGRIKVRLTIGSDGPVADVFVRLLDVFPDGKMLRIARGNLQVDNPESGREVTVDLAHVGYRLAIGHKLALVIASSDYPEYIPQPGTGENPWSALNVSKNTQTITLSSSTPLELSFFELPQGD